MPEQFVINIDVARKVIEELKAEKEVLRELLQKEREKVQYIRWQVRPELWDDLVLSCKKQFPEGLV